jgi:hypothetical protein
MAHVRGRSCSIGADGAGLGALPDTRADLTETLNAYNKDGMLVYESAYSTDVAAKLGDALQELASGSNEKFKADFLAAVRRGPPDFTSGARVPWLQYEAGTVVDGGESGLLQPCIAGPSVGQVSRRAAGSPFAEPSPVPGSGHVCGWHMSQRGTKRYNMVHRQTKCAN